MALWEWFWTLLSNDGHADDDATVQKAQVLKEKTGVTYPLLLPDSGNSLTDVSAVLQSFPESFFVDKDGNIVGDAILGSNNFEGLERRLLKSSWQKSKQVSK